MAGGELAGCLCPPGKRYPDSCIDPAGPEPGANLVGIVSAPGRRIFPALPGIWRI